MSVTSQNSYVETLILVWWYLEVEPVRSHWVVKVEPSQMGSVPLEEMISLHLWG